MSIGILGLILTGALTALVVKIHVIMDPFSDVAFSGPPGKVRMMK